MARIRTLKPEFWQDEKLAPLTPLERLVFLGLISMADDAGRLVDSVKMIDGMLFPLTDDTSREAIETLARIKRVSRYTAESGQKVIQILGWGKHQKVDNPAKYVLPAPTPEDLEPPAVAEPARESSENDARMSRSDLGPRTMDLGPRTVTTSPDGGDVTTASDPDRPPLAIPAVRPPPRKKGAPLEMTDDEAAVMAHYKTRHPKRRPERDTKGVARMREALTDYSVAELCQAIDGNADDPWHRQRGKHEMLYVFRADLIDGFIAAKAQRDEDDIPLRLKDPARAYVWGVAGVERPA